MPIRRSLEILALLAIMTGCSSGPVAPADPVAPAAQTTEKPADLEAEPEPQRIYTRITCKKDKEVQILEIDSTPTQGCVLIHTKGKKRHKLRHSPNSRKPCRSQRDEMLAELKVRAFVCDEPSPLRASSR